MRDSDNKRFITFLPLHSVHWAPSLQGGLKEALRLQANAPDPRI